MDEGMAGDNVGLLLRGVQKDDIRAGHGACQAWFYYSPTTPSLSLKVYILKERRRRPSHSFLSWLQASGFISAQTDVTGHYCCFLPPTDGSAAEMVMPW